ncbi:MAG: LacI family DNA-binding transcriptional regulator [Trueperaceae bacterium]|nr:LacI family DNA-binding transcriptional regulator [Trueperaceae bacterium]
MKRRAPTSREVARRAGVSRSTVSVVLNGVTSVVIADTTRRRVLQAADELGYVPSAAARQLASGRARTLGLVITYSERLKTDAFVPQALFSLNEEAHRSGFRVLVEALEDVTAPDAYHQLVRGKQIDGLIVLNPREDDTRLPKLIADGFPVVVIGHAAAGPQVDVDNVGAARRLCEHLITLGRRRIAHLPYAPLAHHSSAMRLEGWRAALRAAGLDAGDGWTEVADFSAESGRAAMDRLLARRRPDAVFAGNDTVAFGAMSALRAAGLRIPDDVAVVGFDDIPLAAHACPPLTTVRLPAVEMGALAAKRLIARIERHSGEAADDASLPTELVVRRSCGATSALRTVGPPDPA